MTDAFAALIAGRCPLPFETLGYHPLGESNGDGAIVRVFNSWADTIAVLHDGETVRMERVVDEGLFTATLSRSISSYRLQITDHDGREFTIDDPYRFGPVLDEHEFAAFSRGEARRAHHLLGARAIEHEGVDGTCFSVWAPHAHNVNLMAEFNRWDARCHPMRPRGSTGVWELFVPGVGHGTHYKYEIRPRDQDVRVDKTDPYGRMTELRPDTASVVVESTAFVWNDTEWMTKRHERQSADASLAIYEVHLGSWRREPGADPAAGRPGWLGYRALAEQLLPYVKENGFTHVELLPVSEHPLDKSWGYQPVGYFAPTSRYGTPDDLRSFIDAAHQLGIGVLIDWVPAHFPSDAHGLARFDGTPLYEHPDPRRGVHPDWGTYVFDYGRPEVQSFLVSSALFWLEEFHVDGLRVDAVASMLYLNYSRKDGDWIPNKHGGPENLEAVSFLRALNDTIHEEFPGVIVVAEESTAWPRVSHPTEHGGLGFDFKWNMGWMNDTLTVMRADPIHRKSLYSKLTFAIWYAGSERFLLPLSHDEVVHLKKSLLSKMPGTYEQQLANLRLLLGYMWAHPGKKLLFMGGEIGQRSEWNHEGEVEWHLLEHPGHRGVQSLVRELNRLYHDEPALHELDTEVDGFEWLDCHDSSRTTLAFIRWAREWRDPVIVAANFTPMEWKGYRLPVPFSGAYRVLLNSAAAPFEAANPHPLPETLDAVQGELHGRDHYLEFDLPPFGAIFLKQREA